MVAPPASHREKFDMAEMGPSARINDDRDKHSSEANDNQSSSSGEPDQMNSSNDNGVKESHNIQLETLEKSKTSK